MCSRVVDCRSLQNTGILRCAQDDDVRVEPFPKGCSLRSGLLVVAGEAGVGFVEGAVFDADTAGGHRVELRGGLVVEILCQVFCRWVEFGVEGFEVVDHEVVEVFDGGTHDLLEELEVEEHAGLVKLFADEGDEDLVVVAVRVLALAAVVTEVVAGGETGFYSYFKHGCGSPFDRFNGRVWMG
jgi:hypothetical protein